MSSKKQIAIVGGGIAGLSAGWELKKAGFDVTVFEANEYAGGRMLSSQKDTYTFDQGADFFSQNYKAMEGLAKELNIPWKETFAGVKHRVIRDGTGRVYDFQNKIRLASLPMLSLGAKVKLIAWLAKLKLGKSKGDFFELSGVVRENGTADAYDYLAKNVHPEVATYIADSFVSIMQFHRANEIGADALLAFMAMLVQPQSSFSVRYTPPRIDGIPRALAKKLNVKYGSKAQSVAEGKDGVRVEVNGKKHNFDACIIATTAPVAHKIYKTTDAKLKSLLSKTEYAKTMVLSVEVAGQILENTYISFVPFAENKVIAGYTNELLKISKSKRKTLNTYFNIYLHEEAALDLWDKTNEDVEEVVLQELSKVLPELNELEGKSIVKGIKRWDLAMPKFTAKHINRVIDWEGSRQESKVILTGDYLNAPWTEGAARSGKRAAKLVSKLF